MPVVPKYGTDLYTTLWVSLSHEPNIAFLVFDCLQALVLLVTLPFFYKWLGIRSGSMFFWTAVALSAGVALAIPFTLGARLKSRPIELPDAWPIAEAFTKFFRYVSIALVTAGLHTFYTKKWEALNGDLNADDSDAILPAKCSWWGVNVVFASVEMTLYFAITGLRMRIEREIAALPDGPVINYRDMPTKLIEQVHEIYSHYQRAQILYALVGMVMVLCFRSMVEHARMAIYEREEKATKYGIILPLFLMFLLEFIVSIWLTAVRSVTVAGRYWLLVYYCIQERALWIWVTVGMFIMAKFWHDLKEGRIKEDPHAYETPNRDSVEMINV